MTALSLVPAGAGAGKTYHIQQTLADWVQAGIVAPGRILAVTFTEAAASELRGRVRGELMARGRIDDALAIDRAYIGTIHALGQRLLTEHAFAAGRSPEARLLSEAERDLLIRMEMTHCAALAPLMADLGRFGYAWDPVTGTSAEDVFRADVLKSVDLLRGLGARGAEADILAPALDALSDGYGPCVADGAALTEALRQAVKAMLDAFPHGIADLFAEKKSVQDTFARDHTNLRRARRPGVLARDWALWQKLRGLRLSKKGAPTPEGYDDLAKAVIAAADALPRHPGPLADARAHLTALVTGAQEVQGAYQAAKRRAGLIDYADMIVETEALLREKPEILRAVMGEIDCVVIDEFQDTNPVQFALLWRLARNAGRALIVGDAKQSIMGFQGADARLSKALQVAHPEAVAPLDRNWRSVPEIMDLVNTLGPALFPEGYDPLSPQRVQTGQAALEALILPGGRKDTTADCVANRIADLLEEGTEVHDKALDAMRPLHAADIAILCQTHAKCSAMAAALESRGLPVHLRQAGWLTSPAMRAARASLAFAADPDDRHAALTWLTLGPARLHIEDALRNAVDGVLETHQSLASLRALNAGEAPRTVAESVAEVLRATGLRDWAAGLAAPAQALADLARLEAEAQEFDRMVPDLRAAAGFHGCGLQVFLGWIMHKTDRSWDRHPDPDGWSTSGIEVSTWHAAKGREWPVTVVAGLDQKIAARPGTLRAEFDGFDDLEDVLTHAGLGWLPDFAAPETQEVFAEARYLFDEADAAGELYVALTRARDRLILALPKEKSRPAPRPERMVDLLRDRAGLVAGDSGLIVCGTPFPAQIVPGIADEPNARAVPAVPSHARFGTPQPAPHGPRTPWRQSPSTMEEDAPNAPADLQTISLAPGVAETHSGRAAERGTAWHLAFRVFAQRPDLADRLPDCAGLNDKALSEIRAQALALTDWLAAQGYDRLHFELPLQQIAPDGSETNAILDCLAEGSEGFLIVDHKSGPCPDPAARFAGYRPQLMAYAAMVRAKWPEKSLDGVAINWMSEGRVSVSRVGAQATAPRSLQGLAEEPR